jgi:hypothetical protein
MQVIYYCWNSLIYLLRECNIQNSGRFDQLFKARNGNYKVETLYFEITKYIYAFVSWLSHSQLQSLPEFWRLGYCISIVFATNYAVKSEKNLKLQTWCI